MNDGVQLRDVVEADLPIMFQHQLGPPSKPDGRVRPEGLDCLFGTLDENPQRSDHNQKVHCLRRNRGRKHREFRGSGKSLVGYWIGREFWGKGIATKALAKFLEQIPTRPLHAYVATRNGASIRVLEKCGFSIVGRDRTPGDAHREEGDEVVMRLEGPA